MDYGFIRLNEIRENPERYLREKSLWLLSAYMHGYFERQNQIDGSLQSEVWSSGDFQAFVEGYYRTCGTPLGWSFIIERKCVGKDAAWDKFWELFDKYWDVKTARPYGAARAWPPADNRPRPRWARSELFGILRDMRFDPHYYDWSKPFVSIPYHIYGYYARQQEKGKATKADGRFLAEFQAFVEWRHGTRHDGGRARWWEIIIRNSRDDSDAFHEFYRILDEYLEKAVGAVMEKPVRTRWDFDDEALFFKKEG
ncbi:MAG: hypothetical protein LBG71_02940 [Clostridiales Family XIII bacterium]|jgi:hypothetical protein|nr:hypothetical protein [Clostridiales Family XIII bacterium]